MYAHENYKTYGTVEDGIEWEIAEQPLLGQIPTEHTAHKPPAAWEIAVGSLWNVSVCFYRCYRCVSVAWESAVGTLWNVSVCLLWACAGCLGDCCR